ncbi:MAG: hypothetical protein ACO3EO_07560 [Candidatus Kapaibacteriota bacterium]
MRIFGRLLNEKLIGILIVSPGFEYMIVSATMLTLGLTDVNEMSIGSRVKLDGDSGLNFSVPSYFPGILFIGLKKTVISLFCPGVRTMRLFSLKSIKPVDGTYSLNSKCVIDPDKSSAEKATFSIPLLTIVIVLLHWHIFNESLPLSLKYLESI